MTHCFKWWLVAVRQQTIIWANIDPDLCCHIASVAHSDPYALALPITLEFCYHQWPAQTWYQTSSPSQWADLPCNLHSWFLTKYLHRRRPLVDTAVVNICLQQIDKLSNNALQYACINMLSWKNNRIVFHIMKFEKTCCLKLTFHSDLVCILSSWNLWKHKWFHKLIGSWARVQ